MDTAARIGIDRELVYDFFYEFSRFEYALKRARFLKPNTDGKDAKPDWEGFAKEIVTAWTTVKDAAFTSACTFFIANPPRIQIVTDGGLGWREPIRQTGDSDAAFVLRGVRTVRNNLFHGGKFPAGPVTDAARDTSLLAHGRAILRGARSLHTEVEDHYSAL